LKRQNRHAAATRLAQGGDAVPDYEGAVCVERTSIRILLLAVQHLRVLRVKADLSEGDAKARDKSRLGWDGPEAGALGSGRVTVDGIGVADGVSELPDGLGGDDAGLRAGLMPDEGGIEWHRAPISSRTERTGLPIVPQRRRQAPVSIVVFTQI